VSQFKFLKYVSSSFQASLCSWTGWPMIIGVSQGWKHACSVFLIRGGCK
jgi:hypothetical protein